MSRSNPLLDAWTRPDAAPIVAIFAEGGAAADPVSGTLARPAIGADAETLRAACLSFEIAGAAGPGGGVDRPAGRAWARRSGLARPSPLAAPVSVASVQGPF